MDNSNVRLYIGISLGLIVLLILIIVIPFSSKKNVVNNQTTNNNLPTPTGVQSNSGQTQPPIITPTPVTIPATNTGGINEPLPQPLIDLANQKKDLLQKMPLNLGNFSISFDYSQDKFIVKLTDPKDQAQKSFESWRTNYYPALSADKFVLQ